MTDTTTSAPYTDDDLRAEAARQHRDLTEDPDFGGVGEQMINTVIPSRASWSSRAWWHSLEDEQDCDQFGDAQRKIHDLINDAADLSKWAVDAGADGLQPDDSQLTWSAGPQPIVRIHFAFHPGMSDEARAELVQSIGEVCQARLAEAAAQGGAL